jgi:hypothetical protein
MIRKLESLGQQRAEGVGGDEFEEEVSKPLET